MILAALMAVSCALFSKCHAEPARIMAALQAEAQSSHIYDGITSSWAFNVCTTADLYVILLQTCCLNMLCSHACRRLSLVVLEVLITSRETS